MTVRRGAWLAALLAAVAMAGCGDGTVTYTDGGGGGTDGAAGGDGAAAADGGAGADAGGGGANLTGANRGEPDRGSWRT